MKQKTITFGSVCSGIEAASVAWNPLGWQASWLAEIEPFPSAVLAASIAAPAAAFDDVTPGQPAPLDEQSLVELRMVLAYDAAIE